MVFPTYLRTSTLANVLIVGTVTVLALGSIAMVVPQWVVGIAVLSAIVWFVLARRRKSR
jgi:hypothetical protein